MLFDSVGRSDCGGLGILTPAVCTGYLPLAMAACKEVVGCFIGVNVAVEEGVGVSFDSADRSDCDEL